jgi:DNA invertase Pin-like site-specific DNA recombinase
MKPSEKKKAIAYVRVSTDKQEISPKDQAEKINAYCVLKDLKLVDTLVEINVSGGVPLFQRPEGSKIAQAKVDAVVSLKLDRLFRDAADCLEVTKHWDKIGVALHLIDMGGNAFDTSSAMGRMFLTMAAGFAEMERGLISERTTAGLQFKRKAGKRVGTIPFGYDLADDKETLIVNPIEMHVLCAIAMMRKSGDSYRTIAANLVSKNAKTKGGGTVWYASTVKSVLEHTLNPEKLLAGFSP